MSKKIPETVKHGVELLEDAGFKVTDVRPQPNAGFCVLLESDVFLASLILEKGQEFVRIKFNGDEQWIIIYCIRKIIQPETKIIGYQYSFEKDTRFIKDNFITIKELFSDENITNTKKVLKRLFNLF